MTDVATPPLTVGRELPVGSLDSMEDMREGEGFENTLIEDAGGLDIGGGGGLKFAPTESYGLLLESISIPTVPL